MKSTDARQFSLLLKKIGACREARAWAKGKSMVEAWNTCDRSDWMLWLVGRMADKKGWLTRKQVVLAACDCAETALHLLPNGEERPRIAIETARRWANGDPDVSLDDVRSAASASAAAASAAYAAAYAAYAAAYAASAASAAASAYAYAARAAYAAYAAARAECAQRIRSRFPLSVGNASSLTARKHRGFQQHQ